MSRKQSVLPIILFVFMFLPPCVLYGQVSVETSGIFSTESTTPFWFQSNRNGIYSDEGGQFFARIQYHDSYEEFDNFRFLYGVSLIARPGDYSTFSANQGYFKVQGYGFELSAGRFIDPSPLYNQPVGMGSLGISTNATPIPKIKFGLTDWTGVPFTNDFLQVHGYIAHGWLGSERYTDDVLLHEKAGYLKIGGDYPVNLYGGLAHYVQWGGNNHPSEGDIPNRFSDFIDIFLARGGDESNPGIDQAYVVGNQLGTWIFGSTIETGKADLNVYLQSPIETKYDLKLKNISDVLTGISVDFDDDLNLPVSNIAYEYLYTKDQAGPRRLNPDADPNVDLYSGNQNYYNHQTYRTGWAYNLRTIGNPLFKADEDTLGIINNRIVAHHLGFESNFEKIDFFGKITFSRNYGKRCDNRIPPIGEEELFGIQCDDEVTLDSGHSLEQWSFLIGTEFPLSLLPDEKNIFLRIEAAFDDGELFGNQFGLLTSIKWVP